MSRGDGKTHRQIESAPQGAVFLWCNEVLSHPKDLARRLGRTDLHIVGPNWLTRGLWRGVTRPLIIDHAYTPFTVTEIAALRDIRARAGRHL